MSKKKNKNLKINNPILVLRFMIRYAVGIQHNRPVIFTEQQIVNFRIAGSNTLQKSLQIRMIFLTEASVSNRKDPLFFKTTKLDVRA